MFNVGRALMKLKESRGSILVARDAIPEQNETDFTIINSIHVTIQCIYLLFQHCTNSEPNAEVCDATGDDSSNAADAIKTIAIV